MSQYTMTSYDLAAVSIAAIVSCLIWLGIDRPIAIIVCRLLKADHIRPDILHLREYLIREIALDIIGQNLGIVALDILRIVVTHHIGNIVSWRVERTHEDNDSHHRNRHPSPPDNPIEEYHYIE